MDVLPETFKPVWGTVRGVAGANQLRLDLAEPVLAELENRAAFTDVARRADCAFFCSAVSRFEDCARDPVLSYKINVTHTLELTEFLLQHGVKVIYLSSNAVFDGQQAMCPEDTAPCPVTEYGRQKVAAEAGVLKCAATHVGRSGNVTILRLTKVLSARLSLISGWIGDLGGGKRIRAFDDLLFSPVSLRYTASALARLAASPHSGIFHLSGDADVSYYDFASALAARLGVDTSLVARGHSAERSGAVVSPRFSAMGMDVTRRLIGERPQSMGEVIEDLIEEAVNGK